MWAKQMKTLFVDRVCVYREIISGVLDDANLEHVFVNNGRAALDAIARQSFQCICVSLYLDDIEGIELCRQIRATRGCEYIPVVLLTSMAYSDIFEKAILAGITDIFAKDQVHELVAFIERLCLVDQPLLGRVLYVEDNKAQRLYVTALLESHQLQVDAFDNGEQAWQAFLQNDYDLVLTDIVLGGLTSGILLINKIRRLEDDRGDVPILAVTAFDEGARRISLFHMGLSDYVTKPIIEEELIARMRNLIDKQQAARDARHIKLQLDNEALLNHSRKMAALGKLTGGIAHDYNNMLSIMSGFAEQLSIRLQGQPALLRYVDQIQKAADKATFLTQKLLSFARNDHTHEAKDAKIDQLVRAILPIIEQSLSKQVTLELILDEALWSCSIEVDEFEMALVNLVINANHAMADGGLLMIACANRTLTQSQADPLGIAAGDYAVLSVKDNGCGMNEKVLHRAFEPFFSTKGKQGSGLGLSQIYGMVQRAKGAVNITSKVEQGTIVELLFPRSDGQPTAEPEPLEAAQPSPALGPAILVVDDEPWVCELLTDVLSGEGYRVFRADNAEQAQVLADEQPIDLLLTDVRMPGGSGHSLAHVLRERYPEMKIILMTGFDDNPEEHIYPKSGYDHKLHKPLHMTTLLHLIEELLPA